MLFHVAIVLGLYEMIRPQWVAHSVIGFGLAASLVSKLQQQRHTTTPARTSIMQSTSFTSTTSKALSILRLTSTTLRSTWTSTTWTKNINITHFFDSCSIQPTFSTEVPSFRTWFLGPWNPPYQTSEVMATFGSLLGGLVADALAKRLGLHGRPLSAQITVAIGIPLPLIEQFGRWKR